MEERDYRKILVHLDGHVARLTLNVPERKNPLGPPMVNELLYALDDAARSDAVRVLVLTGAGAAFSAGADLKQMSGGTHDESSLPPKGDFSELLLRLARFPKPTIARVPGVTMGGGCGLVAACHFAIAAESATFGTPEVKRGLWPMMIMAVLARVMSRRDLLRLMILGEPVPAAEAAKMGLVSSVVPDERLDLEVDSLASKLATRSPTALRHGLAALAAHEDEPLERSLPALQAELMTLLGTEDAREGLSAFVEKRPPVWTGR